MGQLNFGSVRTAATIIEMLDRGTHTAGLAFVTLKGESGVCLQAGGQDAWRAQGECSEANKYDASKPCKQTNKQTNIKRAGKGGAATTGDRKQTLRGWWAGTACVGVSKMMTDKQPSCICFVIQ